MFRQRGDESAKRRRISPEAGRTGRNYGPFAGKKSDFRPIFSPQVEVEKVLNLLWGHAPIAIAYKTRDICSTTGTTFPPTSTSPRKSLEIAENAKTSKNGFSASCAMRSQNDKCWRGSFWMPDLAVEYSAVPRVTSILHSHLSRIPSCPPRDASSSPRPRRGHPCPAGLCRGRRRHPDRPHRLRRPRHRGRRCKALQADKNVKLVAMGDAFEDRLEQSLANLHAKRRRSPARST